MTRGLAALGSAVFFLIAPTTVAGVVPWWISRWRLQAPFFDLQLTRWFGVVLILLAFRCWSKPSHDLRCKAAARQRRSHQRNIW